MLDYTTKEVIEIYHYSNNDSDVKYFKLNGRDYYKTGNLQALSFVGILYKIYDIDKNIYVHKLFIGYSKQNENDYKNDKNIGYEYAYQKALIDPDIIMNIEDHKSFNYELFINIIDNYLYTIKRTFVKTYEEVMNE